MTNTTYDYRRAVKDDVINYLNDMGFDPSQFENADDASDWLYEELFNEDSITGNASGSYTFNTWKAEENLCHNWDLIEETAQAFGIEPSITAEHGAEYWDVSIRCYLLAEVVYEVVEDCYA